jgi:hypothetical protein
MDFNFTTETLLTVAGNALFVLVILQLLVKPALKEYTEAPWFGFAVNLSALLAGIIGAVLAQFAFGFDYASVLNAVLVGVAGAATAVLGYEMGKNIGRIKNGTG